MADAVIQLSDVAKMYRLYRRPVDKVLDALSVNRWLFWRGQYYDEFWALQDITLSVPRGQRLGIIGPNGAGKSTLLKLIAGSVPPTRGTVAARGRLQALMELGTGFHPELTGRQNIRAALAYQGFTSSAIHEKEEEISDFAEIGQFIDQPIKTYSAGMYARLAFSAATSTEPEILIIDEILGTGDAYFQNKCIKRMREYTANGRATMLFVSHDLGGVQSMCDRAVWLHQGRVIQDGDPLSVIRGYYRAMIEKENRRADSNATDPAGAARVEGANSHSVISWKVPDPRIEHVEFLDAADRPIMCIQEGQDLTIQITYHAASPCYQPAFEAALYTLSGTVVVRAIHHCPEQIEGSGSVRFCFRPLNVGAGAYVMTCSIFEFIDPRQNIMPPLFDQHDRCYHLRILKTPGMEMDLGIVRTPYTVEYVKNDYHREASTKVEVT